MTINFAPPLRTAWRICLPVSGCKLLGLAANQQNRFGITNVTMRCQWSAEIVEERL